MNKGKILIQKVNIEESDLVTAMDFYKKTKSTLPINIKTVIIPHTWDFKLLAQDVVYIKIDTNINYDTTESFLSDIKESLGNAYTYTTGICEAEVISDWI